MPDRIPARAAAFVMAAALLGAPVMARAQPASGAPNTSGQAERRNAFVERRITQLRTEIKITPDEQKSFDDFASVMRQNAAQMNDAVGKGATLPASATAVDRMQTYAEMSQVHAQHMQQLTAAFTTFYNTLTPQQKKIVDASFARQAAARRNAKS